MHNEPPYLTSPQKRTAQGAKHALPTGGATLTARVSHADEEMRILLFLFAGNLDCKRIELLSSFHSSFPYSIEPRLSISAQMA
jgi:hypothetical protein